MILTTFRDDHDVLDALRAGADGYLLKDVDPSELRRSILAIALATESSPPRCCLPCCAP